MSIQGNDGFLDLENASLRVTGNVHAEGLKVGSVRLQPAYSLQSVTNISNTTTQMVQFTNPTKGFDVTSNIEVGDANLYVDTTTGRVGVGTNAPMGTLDVKGVLNHTQVANVAQITSNSNVVMEYRRSKKLIKYPRVAMTSASSGGYVVQTSGNNATSNDGWKAFNGVGFNGQTNAGDHWITPDLYTHDSGAFEHASTAIYQPLGNGATGAGAWIAIKLPHKIKLTKLRVDNVSKAGFRDYTVHGRNGGGAIVGGTAWSSALLTVADEGSGYSITGNYVFTETSHDITTNDYYEEFIIIITKKTPASSSLDHFLLMRELQFFGLPEYDPEAHGTDVTVKSYPNVPNTDWLEVYYDGQDYTAMPATVADKSGNGVTGTPSGGVGFDTEYKAFTFDGVNDYIETTLGSHISGDWTNTVSFWIAWNAIPTSGVQTPFMIGQPNTSTNGIGVDFNANSSMIYFTTSGDIVTINNVFELITPGKWIHFTFIHTPSKKYVYWDGKQVGIWTSGAAATLPTSPTLSIGRRGSSSTNYTNAKIANFRLFNRALTTDEIWQLYAYQKEYFGVSPDVVTLKAGRVGIGTSEPRAVLDVRGDVHISGSLRKTRALMINQESGAIGFTADGWQTYVSYGETWTAYSSDPLYSISITGDYVDGSDRGIHFRIAVQNQRTMEVVYFPRSSGWRKHLYINYSRLDGHGYLGIMSNLTPGDSYKTQLEVDPNTSNPYRWSSSYGALTGIVWD